MARDIVVAFIFGFGLVSISLLVAAVGILKGKAWMVIVGAILFLPFSYYVFGASGANGFTLLPPLFMIVSGAALREKYRLWAWLLVVPAVLEVLWIAGVALAYALR